MNRILIGKTRNQKTESRKEALVVEHPTLIPAVAA